VVFGGAVGVVVPPVIIFSPGKLQPALTKIIIKVIIKLHIFRIFTTAIPHTDFHLHYSIMPVSANLGEKEKKQEALRRFACPKLLSSRGSLSINLKSGKEKRSSFFERSVLIYPGIKNIRLILWVV
jgi:hypothetical protein